MGKWFGVSVVVILLDQITKYLAEAKLVYADPLAVLPSFNLTLLYNRGAAFSFLSDAGGWQRWFFVALASIVSCVLAVWLWRIRNQGQAILAAGLALVLGGAIGNLIDRILLGYVTDFIQVWFGSWAFPSFNVADAGISVGAALLIIDALFFSGREEEPA